MRRIVLTYGLIAGAVMGGMLLLALPFQEQIGFDRGAIVGYTSMVLAFLMVYFGVRSYRDTVAGGSIGFGQAFLVGLGITLVATAVYVATWQVVYYGSCPTSWSVRGLRPRAGAPPAPRQEDRRGSSRRWPRSPRPTATRS